MALICFTNYRKHTGRPPPIWPSYGRPIIQTMPNHNDHLSIKSGHILRPIRGPIVNYDHQRAGPSLTKFTDTHVTMRSHTSHLQTQLNLYLQYPVKWPLLTYICYSLFTLRKTRSPSILNGERGFLRVNRLWDSSQASKEKPMGSHMLRNNSDIPVNWVGIRIC